jgi:hypothetical protein
LFLVLARRFQEADWLAEQEAVVCVCVGQAVRCASTDAVDGKDLPYVKQLFFGRVAVKEVSEGALIVLKSAQTVGSRVLSVCGLAVFGLFQAFPFPSAISTEEKYFTVRQGCNRRHNVGDIHFVCCCAVPASRRRLTAHESI